MSDVEREVTSAFDRQPATLADVGGRDFVVGRERALACTSLMPELLELVLESIDQDGDPLRNFILSCAAIPVGDAEGQVGPSTYQDVVNMVATPRLPAGVAKDCQRVLVDRLSDPGEHEAARWTSMGGALNLALIRPDLRHRLLTAVIEFNPDDLPPEFARRLAKVVGVINSYWPDGALVEILDRLCSITDARDEALFELGMVRLGQGLDAETAQIADSEFEEAKAHFESAVASRSIGQMPKPMRALYPS